MTRPLLLLVALATACGGFEGAAPSTPDAPPADPDGSAAVPADVVDLGAASQSASSSRHVVSGSLDSSRGSMRSDRFHLVGALRARAR